MKTPLSHETVLAHLPPGRRRETRDIALALSASLGVEVRVPSVAACLGYLRREGAVRRHYPPRVRGVRRRAAWEALQEALPL